MKFSSITIESKFHENKDWNRTARSTSLWIASDREQVPRKQGLKPDNWEAYSIQGFGSRASSTKTRIETKHHNIGGLVTKMIESKFHENKDWNSERTRWRLWKLPIESKFHENKDWNDIGISRPQNANQGSRASSTKTRIETEKSSRPKSLISRSRASSTKTRIETWQRYKKLITMDMDREQVPRKQGLKQERE